MMSSQNQRRERGLRAFAEVMTVDAPADSSPAIADGLIDFVFAEVWTRPGLSRRDRRFVTLACVAGASTVITSANARSPRSRR
ncbi:hypothetical protein A9X02_16165 [Mycobacterium malmoense]|nr:hypothetical protein A9X02_16165 [Mycobacterium malmoense]